MQNPTPLEAPSPRSPAAPPPAVSTEAPGCPACAAAPASRAPCFACGRIPAERRSPRALQRAAVDALSRDLTARPHLPDDLRADLLARVALSRRTLTPPTPRVVAPAAAAPIPASSTPRPAPRPIPQTAEAPEPDAPIEPPRPILPDWLRRLGPAAAENLMYLLGGFLVVAGAVYFASTAWTTMSGTARLLLLDGGLLTLGGLLTGVGRLLTRGFAHEPAGRRIRFITAHLAAGLAPLAAVIAGRAALDAPLPGLGALIAVALATLGARRLADGPGHRRAALAALGISLAAAAAPLVAGWPIPAALGSAALVFGLCRVVVRAPRGVDIAHLAGATLTLAAHLILSSDVFGVGSVVLAALAAGLMDHIRSRAGRLAVLALALLAVGPAFTAPDLLPVVCGLATLVGARMALRLDNAPLLGIPLVASLLTYVTAPGPLRQLVQALKAAFMESMGYVGQPVPLAWYGLTCLPYVLGIAWATRRLEGRPAMARVTTGWLLLVTLGLCALSVVSTDPRAPMAVLAADGLVLLGIGLWLRHALFVALAPLTLVGSGIAAAVWLGSTPIQGLLLTECLVGLALIAAVPLARRRDLHRPLMWAAGLPLMALGLAALALPPEPLALPAFALLALGAGLRARHAGSPAWTVAAATMALGLIPPTLDLLGLGITHRATVAVGALLIAAELHRTLRARPRRSAGLPPWILPVGLTAALGLWLVAGPSNPVHPATLALLALLWAHAAYRLHVAPAAPVATLLLAGAATWGALRAGLPRPVVALAPALIGLLTLVLARRDRPRIRRVRVGLVDAGALASLAGAVLGVLLVADGLPPYAGLIPLTLAFVAFALAPETRSAPVLHHLALLVPVAAAIVAAQGEGRGAFVPLLIGPMAYVALDAARRRGVSPLPHADRFAAALVLATALPFGLAILLDDMLQSGPASSALPLALLTGLCASTVRRHPRAATAITLLLGILTLWGPVALRLLPVPAAYRTTLIAATGLLIAVGAHRVGLHRGTARVIAGLIAAGLCLPILPWTGARLIGETHITPGGLGAAPLTVLLLTWAALVVALAPRRHRWTTAALAAVPLVAQWPVLSGLFGTHAPALELAALALAVARRGRLAAIALGVTALVATGGAIRSPLFALTLTAVAALPLLVARRPERGPAIEVTVYAIFAAATAWLIALVPSSGRGPAEILPIVGLIAALIAALVEGAGPRALDGLRTRAPELADALDARIRRTLVALGALATLPLLVNMALMHPRTAPTVVLLAGLLTVSLLLATAARHARRTGRRAAVDAALLALALGHAFAVARSDLLAALDGHHLVLWAVAAPALRVVGGVGPLTVRLRSRALLLPIPALIATLPDHGQSAVACLLAATTWGLAARQLARPVLTGLGLTLLLAAACRVGLAMHVVDPTFYGLPAGLTLIVGAWIEREGLGRRAVEILQLAGIAIADLSVAVQVVRLDHPAHAVLLFTLGLATVAVGWRRKRGDLMIAGATAVVVDVTLHLLRTGFARGFLAAALLIGAGAVILAVAGQHTRMRSSAD